MTREVVVVFMSPSTLKRHSDLGVLDGLARPVA